MDNNCEEASLAVSCTWQLDTLHLHYLTKPEIGYHHSKINEQWSSSCSYGNLIAPPAVQEHLYMTANTKPQRLCDLVKTTTYFMWRGCRWGMCDDETTFTCLQAYVLSTVSCLPSCMSGSVPQVSLSRFHNSVHGYRMKSYIVEWQTSIVYNNNHTLGHVMCSHAEFIQLNGLPGCTFYSFHSYLWISDPVS